MAFESRRSSIATAGQLRQWDYEAIFVSARALQCRSDTGEIRTLLEGKHVAVLSGTEGSRDAGLFLDAALGLGARVAEIRTDFWSALPQEQIRRLAAFLCRLYAAVECQGMRRDIVRMIETCAGIPVYDHIASPGHPVQRLVEQLEGNAPVYDKRRLVVQAVLLNTIGAGAAGA